MTPLSEDHADRLVKFASRDIGSVVDVGCGWAELLLRVVARAPEAHGVGIDLDQTAIEHGRSSAALRHLDSRVDLRVGDAAETLGDRVDAAICIGASQIWGAPVEQALPLDYRAALRALRSLLTDGGRLVYGEAVWSRSPPQPRPRRCPAATTSSSRSRTCSTSRCRGIPAGARVRGVAGRVGRVRIRILGPLRHLAEQASLRSSGRRSRPAARGPATAGLLPRVPGCSRHGVLRPHRRLSRRICSTRAVGTT